MPRALVLVLCLSIVAAFQLRLAAAPASVEAAPVPPEIVALARTLGVDPQADRPRFVSELARIVYAGPDRRNNAVPEEIAKSITETDRAALESGARQVPVPLSAAVWSEAIFRRAVTPGQLVGLILRDRQAALLCYGLAGLDDETLVYLSQHASVLTRLYEHDAAVFAAFAASLRISNDRVVPPGGPAAVPLWESAVGERADKPDRFLRALYGTFDARIAYLYDTIASLDPPRQAFALGIWIEDGGLRASRFSALAAAAVHGYREWHPELLPFTRPMHDLATLLMRIQVESSGAPSPPSGLAFWEKVFEGGGFSDAGAKSLAAGPGLVDAAWLAGGLVSAGIVARADRLDQFAFGQRVFGDSADAGRADAMSAIRAFPRYRMLMLTLERMGIKNPSVHAAAARAGRAVASEDSSRLFSVLSALQGSLALVCRMTSNGTFDPPAAEKLVEALFAIPGGGENRYTQGIARWIERDLLPKLPPGEGAEERVVSALAGPPVSARTPRILWEGQQYRLDFAAAERRRLTAVRARQGGPRLDVALDLARVARQLATDALSIGELRSASTQLAAAADQLELAANRPLQTPFGLQRARSLRQSIDKAHEELTQAVSRNDVKRGSRLASVVAASAESALVEALLSLTYALDLGDPEGTPLLGSNVALRHDFGFDLRDGDQRARRPWDLPRQDFLPGVPWHVTGSLLGLDLALAPMALRRIDPDRFTDAPRVPSNERDTFALGVALMNPRALRDDDRDAIVAAIERGRQRVAAVASGTEPPDPLAGMLALDGWRRRELQWRVANEPSRVPGMFSLAELMAVGGAPSIPDAWGASAVSSHACACMRLLFPSRWRLLAGRPHVAPISSVVPDLSLRVAVALAELHLPAALARPVLAAALVDFLDEASPTDPHDWRALARAAAAVPRQRIEDYVAAAAAIDGPLIPVDSDSPVDR